MHKHFVFVIFGVILSQLCGVNAYSAEQIRIGVLANNTGVFSEIGKEARRGVELAFAEFAEKLPPNRVKILYLKKEERGKDISLRAKALIADGAQLLVGPLSSNDAIELKKIVSSHKDITFINGGAALPDLTSSNPALNFFRFNPTSVQWIAGAGRYALHEKAYDQVLVVAEDYSFFRTQVAAFKDEYCNAGGTIVGEYWLPLSDRIQFPIMKQLTKYKANAIFLGLNSVVARTFLEQYRREGGDLPIIASSNTITSSLLSSENEFSDKLIGAISAAPLVKSNRAASWQSFLTAYTGKYKEAGHTPSLYTASYYINTKAAFLALQKNNWTLSESQGEFRKLLGALMFNGPFGKVYLNDNRQAITNNLVTEVERSDTGQLRQHVKYVVSDVDGTPNFPASPIKTVVLSETLTAKDYCK